MKTGLKCRVPNVFTISSIENEYSLISGQLRTWLASTIPDTISDAFLSLYIKYIVGIEDLETLS